MKNQISYDEVHELFNYDPATGIFINKTTSNGRSLKGSVAGSLSTNGYWRIGVKGKSYKAHRLAWLYVYGYMPEHGLDHRNRIRSDNWIDNLREATHSCNMKNSKIQSNNISGITGVCWHKGAKKWRVEIQDKNLKPIYLGIFAFKLEAAKARYEAEIKHNYPNCQTQSTALQYINQY